MTASSLIPGVCVVAATAITLYQIRLQIIWNSHPAMLKHIIRILMMVPVYALQSLLALEVSALSLYLNTLRECYEAVVIYSFVCLLVDFLEGERHLVYILELKPENYIKLPFPITLCTHPRLKLGAEFYKFTKYGALQYVVVKPFTSVVAFLLNGVGYYDEGALFRMDRGYLYIVAANTVSQAMAIYCLLLFYSVLKPELQPLNFLPKAIVLKSVIFFTYWQSIGLRFLHSLGLGNHWSEGDMDNVLNFILCVEMAGFAVAQWVAWGKGAAFFDPDKKITKAYGASVFDAANLKDLWQDAKGAVEDTEVARLLDTGRGDEDEDIDMENL